MASWIEGMVSSNGGVSVAERLRRSFAAVSIVTGVACAAGIGASVFLAQQGLNIALDYSPLAGASMDMQLAAASAFRVAAEETSGASPEVPAAAVEALDRARVFADLLSDGGDFEGSTFHPSRDPEVTKHVLETSKELSAFAEAISARQRDLYESAQDLQELNAAAVTMDTSVDAALRDVLAAQGRNAVAPAVATLTVFRLGEVKNLTHHAIREGKAPVTAAREHLAALDKLGVDVAPMQEQLTTIEDHMAAASAKSGHALDKEMDASYLALQVSSLETEELLAAETDRAVGWLHRGRLGAGAFLVLLAFAAIRLSSAVGSAVNASITAQLQPAVDLAQTIARGDLTHRLSAADDPLEELDVLRDALNHMADTLGKVVGHISTTASSLGAASSQVLASSRGMRKTTEQVDTEVSQATDVSRSARTQMESVYKGTESLQRTTSSMASSTANMQSQLNSVGDELHVVVDAVGSVAASMEVLDQSVSTLAATQEQMTAALTEVSGGVTRAAQIAEDASHRADDTADTVRGLSTSAQQIGEIVTLISHIADQTNLLALNATIEAAAAGEAGRGFAVVAQEVKALAQQSAQASSRIAERVRAIQNNTTLAVDAIADVAAVIADVRQITASMAAAVEEQSATADTIAAVVHEAANATTDVRNASNNAATTVATISRNVAQALGNVQTVATGIDDVARQVTAMAGQIREARSSVEHSSENLATVASVSNASRASAADADQAAAKLEELATDLSASVTQFTVAA